MNQRVRFGLLLFIMVATAYVVAGQEGVCTVKLARLQSAPELRGFQLGMTVAQVKERVPQLVLGPTDPFGLSKTSLNPDFNPQIDKTTFEGVRTVSLDFLDGRLVDLWIGYDSSFKWKTLDQFTSGMSQALGLPSAWQTKPRGGRVLSCGDFQLTAMLVAGSPSLRLSDTAASEVLASRVEAARDAETETVEAETPAPPIIGDKHNRTFYPAECPKGKDVPEKDRVLFESREAALQAGFKLSKTCP